MSLKEVHCIFGQKKSLLVCEVQSLYLSVLPEHGSYDLFFDGDGRLQACSRCSPSPLPPLPAGAIIRVDPHPMRDCRYASRSHIASLAGNPANACNESSESKTRPAQKKTRIVLDRNDGVHARVRYSPYDGCSYDTRMILV